MAAAAHDDIVSDGDKSVRGTGGPIQLPSKPLHGRHRVPHSRHQGVRRRVGRVHRRPTSWTSACRCSSAPIPAWRSHRIPVRSSISRPPVLSGSARRKPGSNISAVLLAVADAAFAQGAAAAPGVIATPVPGQPDAMIRLPSLAGTDPLKRRPVSPARRIGRPEPARICVWRYRRPPTPIVIVAIAARKDPRQRVRRRFSAVWLGAMIAQLVRPNPAPSLSLSTTVAAGNTDGTLTVSGGQPGVFYTPRVAPGGAPMLPPAYAHKPSANDPTANKGIGQLKLEVDFALTRAGQPPLPPLLDSGCPSGRHDADGPGDGGAELALRSTCRHRRSSRRFLQHSSMRRWSITAAPRMCWCRRAWPPTATRCSPRRAGRRAGRSGARRQRADAGFQFGRADPRHGAGAAAASKAAIPVRRGVGSTSRCGRTRADGTREGSAVARNGSTAILVDASEPGMSYQVIAGLARSARRNPAPARRSRCRWARSTATTTFR